MPREPRSITKRRFKHWQRTRKAMVEKIGTEALNDAQKLKAKVEEIFKEFDKDGSRGIDENELRQGMKELGITLNDEEVKTMLKDADSDDDGFIQLEEFETVVQAQVSTWKKSQSKICSIL